MNLPPFTKGSLVTGMDHLAACLQHLDHEDHHRAAFCLPPPYNKQQAEVQNVTPNPCSNTTRTTYYHGNQGDPLAQAASFE